MKLEELKSYNPYDIVTFSQMIAVPPPEMLVDVMLPRGTVTALTGKPGSGKSWLTLELCRAVATGTKFLNRFDTRVGNVLYIGQDSSLWDYAQQLRKLIDQDYKQSIDDVARGTRLTNPYDDRFHFLIRPGILLEAREHIMRLAATIVSMTHSETIEDVVLPDYYTGREDTRQEIKYKSGVDLIIMDTLSSMTRVDQNSNTSIEIPYRNVRWLASATGAAVVIIHHNSYPNEHNDGERIRGASGQEAAIDCWYHLIRHHRTDAVTMKCKRFRGLTPQDLEYTMVIDEDTASITCADNLPLPESDSTFKWLDIVLEMLPEEGFKTKKQILQELIDQYISMLSETTLNKGLTTVLAGNKELIERGPGKSGYKKRMIKEGVV